MNLSLVLGSFVVVSAFTFALTGSLRASLAAGIAAGLCSLGAVLVVTARWRKAVASLTSHAEPEDVADALKELSVQHARLDERLTLLRAVVNTVPAGLWVTSRDGTLVEHNQALGELLSAPGQQLVGFSARELLRDLQVLAAVENASRSAEPVTATVETPSLTVRVTSLSGGLPGSLAWFTSH